MLTHSAAEIRVISIFKELKNKILLTQMPLPWMYAFYKVDISQLQMWLGRC